MNKLRAEDLAFYGFGVGFIHVAITGCLHFYRLHRAAHGHAAFLSRQDQSIEQPGGEDKR